MHKYILIPDSFKGTLSARDFCAVAREAIGRADPGAMCIRDRESLRGSICTMTAR